MHEVTIRVIPFITTVSINRKTNFTMKKVFWMALVGVSFGLASCNKDSVLPNTDSLSADGAARAGAASATDTARGPHQPPTPIEISALPAAITTAISTSYTGATIERAGKDKEGNFVVLIVVNSQPKGLVFSSTGVFKQELPPPPRPGGPGSGTATGPGQGPRPGPPGSGTGVAPGQGQPGGPANLTKVEVSALPTVIKNYVASNYAGAELKEAGTDKNGNYVVLIVQSGKPKGLLFNSTGVFQKELPPPTGRSGQ